MISFQCDNKKFNYRVGAIIISANKKKVLLHTIKGYNFYLLPGGRVEWLEFSDDAIKRELKEEIALENIELKVRLFLENVFTFNGIVYHEISNNFVIELNENHSFLERNDDFFGIEGKKYIYKWVDIEDIENYNIKPKQLSEVIKKYKESVEFIRINELNWCK